MTNETTTLTRRTTTPGTAAQQRPTTAARAPNPSPVPEATVERPPEEPGKPVNIFEGLTADFEARDGDTLVLTYGEVTIPTSVDYFNIRAGGHSYRRTLKEGDNVVEQAVKVREFLRNFSERDIRQKAQVWASEADKLRAKGRK